jgi:hypothetical protein
MNNNMNFTSRQSSYTRPARDACSEGGASSEDSQQLTCSPLTSDASGEMNLPTPLGSTGSNSAGNTSRTERTRNQMVLVERAPEPLPYSQSIPRRPTRPRHHHPMSPAPVLWMPVLIPAAPHSTNTRSAQIPVVRDLDQYILVTAGNYERMSNVILQQVLQAIQAPAKLRTKPEASLYLKSYFLAVRDRSHVIYVEKLVASS